MAYQRATLSTSQVLAFVSFPAKSLSATQDRAFHRKTCSRQKCPQCTLSHAKTTGRRRRRLPETADLNNFSNLPPNYLKEVCRLIRARSFQETVKKTIRWSNARFTGIVFERLSCWDESTDGIPDQLSGLRIRADYEFIDIPPGVLLRAKDRTATSMDCSHLRLCAVFETYGKYPDELYGEQGLLHAAEDDMQKQFMAWSDTRHSMRTETDLHSVDGPELFRESLVDYQE